MEDLFDWYKGITELFVYLSNDSVQQHSGVGLKSPRLQRIMFPVDETLISTKRDLLSATKRTQARAMFRIIDVDRNLMLRFMHVLVEDAFALREFQAQLRNNIAYNLTELRHEYLHHNPRHDSLDDKPADLLVKEAIKEVSGLQSYCAYDPDYGKRLERELAYYYDTYAWFYFRRARLTQAYQLAESPQKQAMLHLAPQPQGLKGSEQLKNLKQAEHLLTNALNFDQRSAVIYYHAARISLALFELLWQDPGGQLYAQLVTQNGAATPTFDDYLVAIQHYWSQAKANDRSGRFKSELAWIGLRLDEYRTRWKAQLTSPCRNTDHGTKN